LLYSKFDRAGRLRILYANCAIFAAH